MNRRTHIRLIPFLSSERELFMLASKPSFADGAAHEAIQIPYFLREHKLG